MATDEDGKLIGFFGCTIDFQANEGVFKCVVVNPEYRGKGVGKEMMRLAVKFAFEITNVDAVRL